MTRYDFLYLPSILSLLMSTHTFLRFSLRSVVERRGGDEEPGSKGKQSFSKYSVLLYPEKIKIGIPMQTAYYSHVKVKKCWFSIITR